jgi:hypothetical protein
MEGPVPLVVSIVRDRFWDSHLKKAGFESLVFPIIVSRLDTLWNVKAQKECFRK